MIRMLFPLGRRCFDDEIVVTDEELFHLQKCQADSSFWKKLLPPTLKKKNKVPKAPKTKAPTRRKRQSSKDLFDFNDSEVELDPLGRLFMQLIDDDYAEGEAKTSHADIVEKQQDDGRRQTRSAGSGDLFIGLPNEPAPQKQRTKDSPLSSGDSTASKLPPLIINPGAQAKRRKVTGSSTTPVPKTRRTQHPMFLTLILSLLRLLKMPLKKFLHKPG